MTVLRTYLLLLLLRACFSLKTSAGGRQPDLRFFHYGSKQGLSNNIVNCLLQDRTGFIWIGTDNGLNRFDGYNFQLIGGGNNKNTIVSSRIRCLYEDRKGYIWIGTWTGGAHRYNPVDGSILHFVNNGEHEIIGDNLVYSFCEDKPGNIWVATQNGLTCLANRTFKTNTLRNDKKNIHSLPINDVRILCPSKYSDKIWVGTYGGGVAQLDPTTGQFERFPFMSGDPAHANKDSMYGGSISYLYEDEHKLWICEYGAIVQYLDIQTSKYTAYLPSAEPYGLPANAIFWLTKDNKGRIWLGGMEGLIIFDERVSRFYYYLPSDEDPDAISNKFVSTIMKDRNSQMWVGTRGGGVNVFYPPSENIQVTKHQSDETTSIISNYITSIFKNPTGKLWLGTYYHGVDTGRLETKVYGRLQSGKKNDPLISKKCILNIAKLGSQWYTLGIGKKRYVLDQRNGGYTVPFSDLSNHPFIFNNWILSTMADRKGNVWICTYGSGVYRVDHSTGNLTIFYEPFGSTKISQAKANDILEDPEGNIWLATQKGLDKFDPITNLFTNYYIVQSEADTVTQVELKKIRRDKNGNIWVGTDGDGVYLWERNTEKFRKYVVPGNVSGPAGHITSLCLSKTGKVWAGTAGAGIIRIDPTLKEKTKVFDIQNGLPDNSIAGILEDKQGHLWISTLRGLCDFNPATQRSVKTYRVSDGMPSDEFISGTYFQDTEGRMYFGNVGGLVSFVPDSLKQYQKPKVPIVFTDLQLFNHSLAPSDSTGILATNVSYTTSIKLRYNQNVVTFSFAALSLLDATDINYSYRLAGFESQWQQRGPGQRSATYTSLPPGKYRFEVKATDGNGSLISDIKSLNIEVLPPYWKTWWFSTLATIVVIGLGYWFYRRRVQAAIRESRQQSEMDRKISELSLTALRSRMNPHFIFNSLSSVQYLIQTMDQKKAETYVNDLSRLIRAMLENSDKPFIPLSDELAMLNKYIELERMRHHNGFDYRINVEDELEPENLEIPSMLIQPFVENAIIHAFKEMPGKGRIIISIRMEDALLYCAIEDNGIGRIRTGELKEEKLHKSIATTDTRARMELMNKMLSKNVQMNIIDLEDERAQITGTRVELYVPVREIY